MRTRQQGLVTDAWTVFMTADRIQQFLTMHVNACNTGSQNCAIYICTVAPGGSPQESNALAWGLNVNADDHLELLEGTLLPPGYSIYVKAAITNRICLTICGETV